MKKKIGIVIVFLVIICLGGCKNLELPLPEISDGLRGDLGIDKNINEDTIDNYLGREDSVYIDLRMLKDDANYEAIGGDSYLSGYIKGFKVIPYPYICNVEDLPEEVGEPYTGNTLFTHEDNEYIANYLESMDIIEKLFPKDKAIFLMCGGGGYAGMMKKMLVNLGWDENKIYNVGGYWYYKGKNSIEIKKVKKDGEHYDFSLVDYYEIDFNNLTQIYNRNIDSDDVDKVVEISNFVQIKTLEELEELEKQNKSFPLFVFLSGCSSCAKFLPIVQEFSNTNNIKMYSLDLNDVWGTSNSITDRIDRAPSMFIYKDGQVLAFLDTTKDSDYEYYKSLNKLNEWFNKYININSFEKNEVE